MTWALVVLSLAMYMAISTSASSNEIASADLISFGASSPQDV